MWVYSRDKRRWEAKERWRRRDEEAGGCLRQQVADALWELSDRFDVGVWYKKVTEKVLRRESRAASLQPPWDGF